jgi:hypothetical protein
MSERGGDCTISGTISSRRSFTATPEEEYISPVRRFERTGLAAKYGAFWPNDLGQVMDPTPTGTPGRLLG